MLEENIFKIDPKKEKNSIKTEMHTFSETGAGVPAFLAKLWRLVEDPETNNLICWSKDGRSFIIQNQAQFARELLPLNYKHNNMASFIRQLNMYGFHKITSIDNGGLKFDRDEMEFTHPCFKRNCPYLLEHIKRKIATTKTVDDKSALKPEAVTKVLLDVKAMRGRQDSLDSRFSVMKQENEALWREIASLRQKHAKQQQIVNKLIQFLITIVQPQRNMTSVKRHMQLMINDIPENNKMRKTSETESDGGPVIHELGEDLFDDASDEVEPALMVPKSPFARVTTPATPKPEHEAAAHSPQNIERPHSSVSVMSPNFDYSNQSADDAVGAHMNPVDTATTAAAAAAENDALMHTINNDGTKIFYHITEVPDAHPQETNTAALSYNEDNVLTTPMVREEMARNQLLKQKNRQRRDNDNDNATTDTLASTSGAGNDKAKIQRIEYQTSPTEQQQQLPELVPQPIQIKIEPDSVMDPMLFLNVYPDNRVLTPDHNLMSPNLSEDSRQSHTMQATQGSSNANTLSTADTDDLLQGGNSSDLYNPISFMTNDMPTDIFDDNSILSAGENSNIGSTDNFKLAQQQQLGRSTVNGGKFSTYFPGTSGVQPSTSAAAAAFALVADDQQTPSTSKNAGSNGNASNMALAKYKNNNQDVLRDEVNGHIDIVQDELDTLKDLLRGDSYSLDHSTLLGVSLPIINAHDDEETNYKDVNILTAGSKQISNSNQNDDNFDADVEQTRLNILQFLNNSLFNDMD